MLDVAEDWPNVTAQPVPTYDQPVLPLDTEVSGADAIAMLGDLFGHLFPNPTPM